MKKTVIALGMVSTVMMTGNVVAAPATTELKVVGQMSIPACEVDAKQVAVDLGNISHSLIKPNSYTELSAKETTIGVTCEAETYLNFTMIDNRKGTVSIASPTAFGLGNVNGAGKLGFYGVNMKNASVDGSASGVYSATLGSSAISSGAVVALDQGKVMGWAEQGRNAQISGKRFVATLQVLPNLAPSKVMGGPIKDKATLDGSATLNFSYGL